LRRIESLDDIAEGLDALARIDPRLVPLIEAAGDLPLRRSPPGFASLASIITSQQVSLASAAAIFARFSALLDPLTPAAVLRADDSVFREAGQSRAKQATLTAIAREIAERGLDLDALCALEPADATARLTAIRGVGPWTAEIYLLFAAGHPDIFPAGDLALQVAAQEGLGLDARPPAKELYAIAESWAPWRGVAARLLWGYYRKIRGRDAAPLVPKPAERG
jgi:DNA-3-methyladenine glycosylase II